jgi:hypothetical protein
LKEDASNEFEAHADVKKVEEEDDISEDWDHAELALAFRNSR